MDWCSGIMLALGVVGRQIIDMVGLFDMENLKSNQSHFLGRDRRKMRSLFASSI